MSSKSQHQNLSLKNLEKCTATNKSVNELEILETSSSTSNSNKENFTTNKKTKKNPQPNTNTTHINAKNQSISGSKKMEFAPKPSGSNINTNGKSLTNKIKNKYKNISKKENRLTQTRSIKTSNISSKRSIDAHLSRQSASPSSQATASDTIINQINFNIASLKKPNSLNLSLIRDELTASSQQQETGITTNTDKELRNSTNLGLRTTRQQRQTKLALGSNPKNEPQPTITALKRLNGQNGDSAIDILNKRRKLTDINLVKNESYKANNVVASLSIPITPTSESRTRFSQRINNTSK